MSVWSQVSFILLVTFEKSKGKSYQLSYVNLIQGFKIVWKRISGCLSFPCCSWLKMCIECQCITVAYTVLCRIICTPHENSGLLHGIILTLFKQHDFSAQFVGFSFTHLEWAHQPAVHICFYTLSGQKKIGTNKILFNSLQLRLQHIVWWPV